MFDDTIQDIVGVIQPPMVVMVNPGNVKDLAFVFRPDDASKGRALQGMTNSRADKLYSFPFEVPEYRYTTCYTSTIWYGLEVTKVLHP